VKIYNKKGLYILSLAFLLFAAAVQALDADATKTVIIGIDLVGVTAGIILLISMITMLKSVGGIVGASYRYIIYGISSQILALAYTLIFVRFKLYPIPAGIDIHHLLMIIGVVFFAFAAYKLKPITTQTIKDVKRRY